MRRTVDLLAQVPYVEAVTEQLRTKARRALKAINRFPVCELEDLLPKGQNGQGGAAEPGPEAVPLVAGELELASSGASDSQPVD